MNNGTGTRTEQVASAQKRREHPQRQSTTIAHSRRANCALFSLTCQVISSSLSPCDIRDMQCVFRMRVLCIGNRTRAAALPQSVAGPGTFSRIPYLSSGRARRVLARVRSGYGSGCGCCCLLLASALLVVAYCTSMLLQWD